MNISEYVNEFYKELAKHLLFIKKLNRSKKMENSLIPFLKENVLPSINCRSIEPLVYNRTSSDKLILSCELTHNIHGVLILFLELEQNEVYFQVVPKDNISLNILSQILLPLDILLESHYIKTQIRGFLNLFKATLDTLNHPFRHEDFNRS